MKKNTIILFRYLAKGSMLICFTTLIVALIISIILGVIDGLYSEVDGGYGIFLTLILGCSTSTLFSSIIFLCLGWSKEAKEIFSELGTIFSFKDIDKLD